MLDILNRVGPPQATGLREDRNKLDVSGDTKHFLDHLKQKIDKPDTEKFKTKTQADSSGGIKKKMTKPESDQELKNEPDKEKNDQVSDKNLNDSKKTKKAKADTESLNFDPNMVLMLMASTENEIKAADFDESLQQVESQTHGLQNANSQAESLQHIADQTESLQPSLESAKLQQSLNLQDTNLSDVTPTLSSESAHSDLSSLQTEASTPANGVDQLANVDAFQTSAEPNLQDARNVFVDKDAIAEMQPQFNATENKDLESLSMDGQTEKSDFQSRVMQTLQQENAYAQKDSKIDLQTSQQAEALSTAMLEKKFSMRNDSLSSKADATVQTHAGQNLEVPATSAAAKGFSSAENFAGSDFSNSNNDFSKNSAESNQQSHHVGVGHAFSTKLDQAGTNQGIAVGGANINSAQRSDDVRAVQDIMNRANFLVTQGGGEVTMRLDSLNGAGEVHLKVMMENGKINVELNTQDRAVKKLIEESLSDLKSSLASHQMSLEHVKINNVVAGANVENQSQHLQQDQSDTSKQFGQFQQQMQQQSQKQQAFESAKQWGNAGGLNFEKPVQLPLQNLRQSAASRYYGLNKGNSLNAIG